MPPRITYTPSADVATSSTRAVILRQSDRFTRPILTFEKWPPARACPPFQSGLPARRGAARVL
jgi:hypothetical protein